MDRDSLRALEYHKILRILGELTVSGAGADAVESLTPLRDIDRVSAILSEVSELQGILESEGDIPIHGISDIRGAIERLSKDVSILFKEDLISIRDVLKVTDGLRPFFKERDGSILREKADRLPSLKPLLKRLDETFDLDGGIRDSASKGLLRIREEASELKERIRGILERILGKRELQRAFSDRIITVREGRFVLPVRRDFQHLVNGIVHDESQSGATYYIEPMETLPLNNQLTILKRREDEEIKRILESLTQECKGYLSELEVTLHGLIDWDLLYARARLGLKIGGTLPRINAEGRLSIKGARHPLLLIYSGKRSSVVPIDVSFGEGKRILVISGANAGGKTVSLKTIGLLVLMLQTGILVPVDDRSEFCIFGNILADIGDEQSIEESMSTFSAHMRRMGEIIGLADSNTLVLIDEIGTGTDPVEGAALAVSFLETLKDRGARVVVTTHYPQVKLFAHIDGAAENLSVEFNTHTNRPTYRLISGLPGVSNAITMAESLGIPADVIERARGYLREGDKGFTEMIEHINKERERLLKEREEAEALRLRLETLKKRHEEDIRRIEESRDAIINKTMQEISRMKREFRAGLEGIINDIKGGKIRGLREAESKVEELYRDREVKRQKRGRSIPEIGDIVYLPLLKEEGRVVKIGRDRVEVETDRCRVMVGMDEFELRKERDLKQKVAHGYGRRGLGDAFTGVDLDGFSSNEINIIGTRVDDAIKAVDRFLDRALLMGLDKVYIIHGIGTGRLRDAVSAYLKGHPSVASFVTGEINEGVTTVVINGGDRGDG